LLLFGGPGDGIPTKIDYIGAGGGQIFLVSPLVCIRKGMDLTGRMTMKKQTVVDSAK
jgi:hypothetical protein